MQPLTMRDNAHLERKQTLPIHSEKFNFPSIEPGQMEMLNVWYRSNFQYTFQVNKQNVSIALKPLQNQLELNNTVTYVIEKEGGRIKLCLETELLTQLFSLTEPSNLEDYSTEDAALLLEYTLDPILAEYENKINSALTIKSVDYKQDDHLQKKITQDMLCGCVNIQGHQKPFYFAVELENGTSKDLENFFNSYNNHLSQHIPLEHYKFLPLQLCVGFVEMRLGQAASLERGDVIVLEDYNPDLLQILAHQNLIWQAQRSRDKIRISSKPSRHIHLNSKIYSTERSIMSEDNSENGMLGEIPVVMSFEIGRKDVSVQDLKNYQEGTVIDFPNTDQTKVQIFANGRQVGQGSLTKVGEVMGVQINRIFSND
ncbi:MAG: FliM/FliN family flagellar motor switch protein [Pseudomonadota bacterium]